MIFVFNREDWMVSSVGGIGGRLLLRLVSGGWFIKFDFGCLCLLISDSN